MTLSLSALMEGQHHMTVHLKVDGSQKLVAEVTTDGWSAWPVDIKVSTDLLKETGNELVMTLSGDANGYRFVTYDKLVVEYPNNLQGTAATPDITLASNISPEQLSSGLAELLIISHPSLIGPALDEYISLRESEGWKIKLVDVDDIYEAYGYGMALPSSITDFLTDARATGFSHVQIVGASNYDYHDYLGLNSISFIPSIYVNTNNMIEYTPCDTCYVLDEGELPYAAIGRWPVRSEAELQAVVNKTRTWKSSGQSSAKTALLIADQNEESSNYINNVELAAEAMFDQGWTDIETVYLDDELALAQGDKNLAVSNARYEIDKYLENGASLTLFSGHGAPDRWSFAGMLRQQDIASINNSATPTLALPLTCYTTYAESPRTASLAYQLISAGDHGAVAVYGPATLSEDSENTAIAKEVISGLLSNQTIGSAVMSAKRKLGAPFRDVILNSNILGDVTLKH